MRIKGEWRVKELIDILSKVPETECVEFEIKINDRTEGINYELKSLTQEEFESMLEEVRYVAENYN